MVSKAALSGHARVLTALKEMTKRSLNSQQATPARESLTEFYELINRALRDLEALTLLTDHGSKHAQVALCDFEATEAALFQRLEEQARRILATTRGKSGTRLHYLRRQPAALQTNQGHAEEAHGANSPLAECQLIDFLTIIDILDEHDGLKTRPGPKATKPLDLFRLLKRVMDRAAYAYEKEHNERQCLARLQEEADRINPHRTPPAQS